jgi:hypothetical protein
LNKPLPSSGPEREIFLRALREYSDHCQPPTLTAGCPFAHDLPGGIRGCLEECMVLLAEYNAPPSVDEIRVGNSLALRPRLPRARRSPTPKPKPFDAVEIYYTDSQLPDITQWRVTALLEAVKRIAIWQDEGDSSDRLDRFDRLRAELERRGLNLDELFRSTLSMDVAARVYAAAISARVMGSEFTEDVTPIAERAESWIPVLGLEDFETSDDDDLPQVLVSAFSPRRLRQLMNWARVAPLSDVIDVVPPAEGLSNYEAIDDSISREDRQQYRWIMDRFTTTYLSEWRFSSLKMEWKYQHGLWTPPCGNRDMAVFSVSENDLAKQIAARSIEEEEDGHASGLDATAFASVAAGLLNAGRRKEAAAIFEAIVRINPRDSIAINNWAFCLMPESPDKALELLDRASGIGHVDHLLLTGNRLWCLLRLNRLATALSLSDAVIGSLADESRRGAHMWSLKGDVVEVVDDLRVYVIDVISSVVEHSADDSISERWNPLLETVRGAVSGEK